MAENDVAGVMREDWNRRAREDAHYYVAFGRRGQDDDEFFETAADVLRLLKGELKRLRRDANGKPRRALEIGCGPGRLMKGMSEWFEEIHGVDVSDEMIRLAREKLRDIPNAHLHHTGGSSLELFAAESFDLVYSYAVFQHIPSREVVFRYMEEALRVLKEGGILRCQMNGLPESARRYDTWNGVRIGTQEVMLFAREHDSQLLALEGANTQYMWATFRKMHKGWLARESAAAPANTRIQRITNAYSSEPLVPMRGKYASVSMWLLGLPEECDLNHLEVRIGGSRATPTYIGPPERDGIAQVNARLPEEITTGLQPVELSWKDTALCEPGMIRVIPAAPAVPRLVAVTDAVNLLAGGRIESRIIKVTLEDSAEPERLRVLMDGLELSGADIFCTDPLPPRFEVNLVVPPEIKPGPCRLEVWLGKRQLGQVEVQVECRAGG